MTTSFFGLASHTSLFVHEWTSNATPQPAAADWYQPILAPAPTVATFTTPPTVGRSTLETFAQRRSVRHYAAAPLDLAALGDLLQLAAPERAQPQAGLHRFSPTSRCLLAPLVLRPGADLASGAYGYDPHARTLHTLRAEDPLPMFSRWCFQAEFLQAPVILLVAGSLQHSTSGGDRGYRHWMLDTGALLQRLYLASAALGLVGSITGSFMQPMVGRWLGWDGYTTTVLAGFALGYPQTGETHA